MSAVRVDLKQSFSDIDKYANYNIVLIMVPIL